jgi:hypothetical protein
LDAWKAEQEQLVFIRDEINHFKQFDNIKTWQAENEPLLEVFGECPKMSANLIKREVALIKSLDSRPVMITDSGELSSWLETAKLGDKFGHTLYRVVYNPNIGNLYYYLPPAFYHYKAKLAGLSREQVIVAELQAEPWLPPNYTFDKDYDKLLEQFPLEKIQENISYAKKTGASEIYLWGVEWWYWLKEVKNKPEIWEAMKNQF